MVAGITPFNFPAMVPMWMFCNALVCGNTFVLKPSEKDPSVSLLLADLLRQAGLPDGAFNVVQGDREAVDTLLEHPDVQALSFVGSTPVARHIYETGTRAGKRVQALGGAKNHMVVLPDADVDAAADAAVSAGYGSAGERCMAISVVVAVGGIADPLVAAIGERIGRIRIGPATDPSAEMGPLITPRAPGPGGRLPRRAPGRPTWSSTAARIRSATGRGSSSAPRWWTRSTRTRRCTPTRSSARSCPSCGPTRYDDALKLVNDNPYGNGTAIFTRDGGAARRFQYDVVCGMVGVNVPVPVPVAYYSFGGWKSSLFGDLHMYGPEGIQFYTRARWSPRAGPTRLRPQWTSASRKYGEPWTSASSSSATRPRGTWSRWPRRPRRPASATCGRSTRTCCGRSRSSSTARSSPPPSGSWSGRW